MRNDKITILEIGLLRPDTDGRRLRSATEGRTSASATEAPSLEMWRAYFPRAEIFGFDIDDFSQVRTGGCKIIRGDMSSRDDLAQLVSAISHPIDIVIEDGSHASHQQIAPGRLFPQVRSRGIYVIEDLHWQDEELERKEAQKTRDILRRLQIEGTFESPFLPKEEQNSPPILKTRAMLLPFCSRNDFF